jgi:proteasome lid subunit RPN8/RPN11
MITTIKEEIKQHALDSGVKEACGFIIQAIDGIKIFKGRNIAEDSHSTFGTHPQDYLTAEREGKIIGVYHSHPEGPLGASKADRICCNTSKLPWYIYSVPDDDFITITPVDEVVPLLGRQFIWGVLDCYTFVRDYYQQILNITFKDYGYYEARFWDKGCNYYEERFTEVGFYSIPIEDIKPHDVILFKLRAPVSNHGAVYVGNSIMWHHLERRLSADELYNNSWRRITSFVLRHKEVV